MCVPMAFCMARSASVKPVPVFIVVALPSSAFWQASKPKSPAAVPKVNMATLPIVVVTFAAALAADSLPSVSTLFAVKA